MDELTRIFCNDSSVAVQYVFAALAEQTLSNQIFLKNDVEIVQTKKIQGLKTRFREIAVGQFLDPRLKDRQTEFPDFFRQKPQIGAEICPLEQTDQSPTAKRQRSCAAFLFDALEEIMSSADQPGTSATKQHSQPDLRSEFMDYVARPREPLRTQVKEGTGRDEIAFIFNNTSKITIEEKMLLEESILSLNDMAKKIGLIKCAVRVSIARKPSVMNLARKQDGTICTDGQHKAQFIFPNNIKFKIGDELTVHTPMLKQMMVVN
uniref:Uncharacterized protein n=1 Tax=Globodera rostochiensis TaxID=31243 RepID=A0A914GX42_GLORO